MKTEHAPSRSNRARTVRWVIGVSLASLVGTACGSTNASAPNTQGSSGKTILLGSLQPLTGPVKFLGEGTQDGIQLAISQINAQGGIKALGGAKLALTSADSSSSDVNAATVAMSQLLSKHPAAVIGPTDSTTFIPASTVAERAKVPICTSSFADNITERGYKYTYELPQRGGAIGQETAKILPQVLPSLATAGKKVAVLYDATNPAGPSEVKPIEQELTASGYTIVYSQGFSEGLTTALPLATGIKASGANIFVDGATSPSDALVINKALDTEGLHLPTLLPGGGLATSVAYSQALGRLVNGSFVVAQWVSAMKYPNAAQNSLLAQAEQSFVKQTGRPFMGQFAGEAYVCTWLFADAMEIAKSSDPAAIQRVLQSHAFSSGPASLMPPGVVQFNKFGLDGKAENVVAEWCNGRPTVVYPPQYAVAKVETPQACGL